MIRLDTIQEVHDISLFAGGYGPMFHLNALLHHNFYKQRHYNNPPAKREIYARALDIMSIHGISKFRDNGVFVVTDNYSLYGVNWRCNVLI